jgi:uncharacterized C2H2 Zn-finger protein
MYLNSSKSFLVVYSRSLRIKKHNYLRNRPLKVLDKMKKMSILLR